MQRLILSFILVAITAAPSFGARARLRGIAASDPGRTVLYVVRLSINTFTGVARGPFRCHSGSVRCLFARGQIAAQFFSDGSFSGRILAARGSCAIAGSLAGSGVVGR